MNFDWQIDPADIFVCASPPEITDHWHGDITQPIAGNTITVVMTTYYIFMQTFVAKSMFLTVKVCPFHYFHSQIE